MLLKTLEFEIVTPVYLGSADPEAAPRIAARPIADMWRQVYRGLAAGVIQGATEKDCRTTLLTTEATLFGGISPQALPSQFRMHIAKDGTRPSIVKKSYLNYGVAERQALVPGPASKFTIELVCMDAAWEVLRHVIHTWALVGGLGGRQRRGFGAIAWIAEDGAARPVFTNLKTDIGDVLSAARAAVASHITASHAEVTTSVSPVFEQMEVLHPTRCVIRVSKPFKKLDDAMEAFRRQLHWAGKDRQITALNEAKSGWRQRGDASAKPELRSTSRGGFPYYPSRDKARVDDIARSTRGTRLVPPPHIENVAFGLPIPYPSRNITISATDGGKELRRPSPVRFRIIKRQTDYHVLTILHRDAFLPEGAKIVAKVKGSSDITLNRVDAAVRTDLDKFFAASGGEEVVYR